MTRSPLWRHGDFLRLWAAQTVSDFGARITREGLPIMAVVTLAAQPAQLGVLASLSSGAALLVGLAAGDYVDRTPRRRILIAADLLRAAQLVSIPLAAIAGALALWQVYAVAAGVAACSALFAIADHAYLPSLVGREHLLDANGKISATESMAETGGPALAGVLFQWLTAPIAVAVNAATYILSAAFLARIRTPEPAPDRTRRGDWWGGVVGGARAAWSEPVLRALLAMGLISGLFGGFFSALYIVFALRDLQVTPALLGLAIAAGGAGAFIGSALAQPVARALGVGPAILITGAASGLTALAIAFIPPGQASGAVGLIATQVLGDGSGVITVILAVSLRQGLTPQALLGRVGATFQAAAGGAAVAGALIGGLLGELGGARLGLLVAGGGLLLAPLLGSLSPLRRVRTMPS